MAAAALPYSLMVILGRLGRTVNSFQHHKLYPAAAQVIANFNAPAFPNIMNVASAIGWTCAQYELNSQCTTATSRFNMCGAPNSPPPSPPSPPPPPPSQSPPAPSPPYSPCPLRFTEAPLVAVASSADVAAQACVNAANTLTSIITTQLGPNTLTAPFL